MISKDRQLSYFHSKLNLRHQRVNLMKSMFRLSLFPISISCVKRATETVSMNSVFALISKSLSQIRTINSSYHNAMLYLILQTIHYFLCKKEVNLRSQPYINLTAPIASSFKSHSVPTNCTRHLFQTRQSLTTKGSSISWAVQTAKRTKS